MSVSKAIFGCPFGRAVGTVISPVLGPLVQGEGRRTGHDDSMWGILVKRRRLCVGEGERGWRGEWFIYPTRSHVRRENHGCWLRPFCSAATTHTL